MVFASYLLLIINFFFLVMMFPVMKILEGYLITTPEKKIWWGVSYLLWNYFEVYIYM
jgi:hypothetical protein